MPVLRLERVAFAHADAAPIVSDLDLRLDAGWTALVGANGAGKTTLLRLVAGELAPSAGLEQALVAFPGALLLVTHDDAFAAACTSDRWRVAAGRVETTGAAPAGEGRGGGRRGG